MVASAHRRGEQRIRRNKHIRSPGKFGFKGNPGIDWVRRCRSPVPVQASEADKAHRDTDDVQGCRETPGCF
jgi:hypothetical protein